MTTLEALNQLGAALDCLAQWDRLLESLDASATDLGIDPDPIGRHLCSLDAAARSLMRQIEAQYVP